MLSQVWTILFLIARCCSNRHLYYELDAENRYRVTVCRCARLCDTLSLTQHIKLWNRSRYDAFMAIRVKFLRSLTHTDFILRLRLQQAAMSHFRHYSWPVLRTREEWGYIEGIKGKDTKIRTDKKSGESERVFCHKNSNNKIYNNCAAGYPAKRVSRHIVSVTRTMLYWQYAYQMVGHFIQLCTRNVANLPGIPDMLTYFSYVRQWPPVAVTRFAAINPSVVCSLWWNH